MTVQQFSLKYFVSIILYFFIFGSTNIIAQDLETKQKKVIIVTTTIDDKGNEITERKILEGEEADIYLKAENKTSQITVDEELKSNSKKQIIIRKQIEGADFSEQQIEQGKEDIQILESDDKTMIIKMKAPDKVEQADEFVFISSEDEKEGTQVEIEKSVEILPDGSEKTVITKTIIKPASNKAFLGIVPGDTITEGVLVDLVIENSPAEKAGLKKGDIITQINETAISSNDILIGTLATFKPSDTINIGYTRNGNKNLTETTLTKYNNNITTNSWKTDDGEVIELKEGQKMKFIKKEE